LLGEHRLWWFENGLLRKTLGPKRDEMTAAGGDSIIRSFISCAGYYDQDG
jgi:hypothetical protein